MLFRSKQLQNFMKLILVESWLNLEAHHNICFEFLESFICILVKGNVMPINAIFVKTIIWSNYTFQKIMNFIWLDSLLELEANHHQGFRIWEPFECILKMGKEGGK